jgi:cysteine desulfurase
VERARQSVAALLGVGEGRIIFTSSATEANNLAIGGLVAGGGGPCHVVSTMIEHKSVLEPLKHLESTRRIRVTWLRPDPCGQVHPQDLQAALQPDTRLVSIMVASNVIHTVNPVGELAAICAAGGVLFHVDATQYAGRLPVDVSQLGVDALSLSAHKIHGPKGVGALYLSRRALQAGIVPQILGGGQEEGLRSGTLNVPAIVGLGTACELAAQRLEADAAHNRELARRLLEGLTGRLGGVTLNGHPTQRIPGGLHLTLAGVDSKGLIASVPEVAFSDGSACETERDPDYVLKAIVRPEAAHHSNRLQVGRTTTPAEIASAIELLLAGVERMRAFAI